MFYFLTKSKRFIELLKYQDYAYFYATLDDLSNVFDLLKMQFWHKYRVYYILHIRTYIKLNDMKFPKYGEKHTISYKNQCNISNIRCNPLSISK